MLYPLSYEGCCVGQCNRARTKADGPFRQPGRRDWGSGSIYARTAREKSANSGGEAFGRRGLREATGR